MSSSAFLEIYVRENGCNCGVKYGDGNNFCFKIYAILEARKPEAGGFVLDGVEYVLSRILNSKQISVYKHSPDKGSKTANIIDVMEYLIDNFANLNTAELITLENLIEKCRQDK